MINSTSLFIANTLINGLLLIWVIIITFRIHLITNYKLLLIGHSFLLLAGYILLVLRPILPTFYTMMVANTFLIISSYLILKYISLKTHKTFSDLYQGILILIFLYLLYYVTYPNPSFHNRATLVSATIFLQTLPMLIFNLKASYRDKPHYKTLYRIYTFYLFLHLLRIASIIQGPANMDVFTTTLFTSIVTVLQVFTELGILLAVISLLIFFNNRDHNLRR